MITNIGNCDGKCDFCFLFKLSTLFIVISFSLIYLVKYAQGQNYKMILRVTSLRFWYSLGLVGFPVIRWVIIKLCICGRRFSDINNLNYGYQ